MTRRDLLWMAAARASGAGAPSRLMVPVHRVMDSRARCTPEQLQHFWWSIWPEAVLNFSRGGIGLQTTDGPGEVRRSPGDRPIFAGLRRGAINLVLTDHIPMKWDSGRALAGATTIYDGYHVSMVALRYAHGNQNGKSHYKGCGGWPAEDSREAFAASATGSRSSRLRRRRVSRSERRIQYPAHLGGFEVPWVSVNTCVHELLHALLQDVFVSRPKWYQGGEREFRTDWYATCLWLFRDGAAIRQSGRAYLDRLRSAAAAATP